MREGRTHRDLRRFAVEWLCLLMLLYGSPLEALAELRPEEAAAGAFEEGTQADSGPVSAARFS